MQFIDGFTWAVSTAFANALDQCRFERGDRLYPTREAYESNWLNAQGSMQCWVQVRFPERMSAALPEDGDSRFESNWVSELRLSLFTDQREVEEVVTTQGRLYTLLWRGDAQVLQAECPEPEVPKRASFVLKRLRDGSEDLRALSDERPAFWMPFDRVSPISLDKYSRLEKRLAGHLLERPRFIHASDVSLLDGHAVAPTTGLMHFSVANLNSQELGAEIKAALYRPAKGAKKDRFKLSAHGFLL